jgi:hypothetical protein
LIGAWVSGAAPAGGVRDEKRKQSKCKRISKKAITGKQPNSIHTCFLRMAHREETVLFAEK